MIGLGVRFFGRPIISMADFFQDQLGRQPFESRGILQWMTIWWQIKISTWLVWWYVGFCCIYCHSHALPQKPKTAPNFNRNIIFWSFLLRVAESDFGRVILRHWVLPFAETSSPKPKKKPALAACPCRPPHLKMFVAFCCSIRGTRWSTTCPKTIQRSKVRASTFSGDFWKQMSDVKDIFSPWDVGAYYMIGTDFTSYNWACWWHCLWDRPIQVVWNICWLYLHYVESSSGWKHVSFWIGASWNLSRIHFVAITSKMSTFFGVVASKLRYSSV